MKNKFKKYLKKFLCPHGSFPMLGGEVKYAGITYKVCACDKCGEVFLHERGSKAGVSGFFSIDAVTYSNGMEGIEIMKAFI